MTRTIPDPTQYIPGLTGMAGEIPLKPDIPLPWVQGAGRLQHLPAHAGVPHIRWRVFLNDVEHFLRHWAERAADLSWDAARCIRMSSGASYGIPAGRRAGVAALRRQDQRDARRPGHDRGQ